MRDLLIYGALFLGWLLFNWIASRAKGAQRARRAAEHARSAPAYEAEAPAPLDTGWGRVPSEVPEYVPEPVQQYVPEPVLQLPTATAADAARRRVEQLADLARSLQASRAERAAQGAQQRRLRPARRPRVHTQDDLRDAIVLTSILGPCRAYQPWEPPDRQA